MIATPPKNKLLFGGAVFVIGFMAPLLIPVVMSSNLATEWKTGLAGFLALGIPEVFMLIAAAILGKQGFAYLKSKLWQLIAPPETVGPVRYRLGLLMFWLPILFIWLHPYLEQMLPGLTDQRVMLGLLSNGLLVVSLFILGGEFWEKLRGLFLYHVRVVPVTQQSAAPPTAPAAAPPTFRLLLGGACFGLSLFMPVFIPLLTSLPITESVRYVIAGLMVFGIPQLLMLLAVTTLGKSGFVYLKRRLGRLFAGLLATQVSEQRYRLGILLLAIPILVGFGWPYLTHVFDTLHIYKTEIAIAGDLILILAVFVLGGEFWEKLISLFCHESRVATNTIT